MKKLFLLFLTIYAAKADIKCIGPSATGNGSGSDWNNQAAWGTFTPSRPSTNYVQDNGGSSYATRTFTTAASGELKIVIRKATSSEHGTDTGWTASLGDQQILSAKIGVQTYHIEFDGVTGGGPGQWTNNLGWKIFTTGETPMLQVGPRFSDTTYSNIVFKHFELTGNGSQTGGDGSYQVGIMSYNAQNVTLSHSWIYGTANSPFFLDSNRNITNQYIWIGRYNLNTIGTHGEVAVVQDDSAGTIGDHTFRYMIVTDHQSTGGIMWDNAENHNARLYIYGNVWVKRSGSSWGAGNNGIIGGWTGGNGEDCYGLRIYNNTFIDIPFGTVYTTLPTDFGNNGATNNLHYNINGTLSFSVVAGHNYNHFINAGGTYSEANGTSGSSNPFTDYPNLDFSLTANTTAGVDLGAPFNVDMLGHTRTTWTRGAIEFIGTDTTPPNISNLRSNTPTSNGANITWDTDDNSSTWIEYGLTSGYGTAISNTTLVTSHSINITGLSASTLYHFRASSTNSIPLGTNTADFTFTTAASDITPPSISITNPTDTQYVSNTLTIAVSASDANGISSIDFYVGGSLFYSTATEPYSVVWNTRNYANGTIALAAVATDINGNKATNSISVNITNVALTGPIVWFKVDENTGTTTTDSISGNVGTLRNGATWAGGKINYALSLDGVNDRIDAPISSSINQTNSLTVMAWINITTNNLWQQFVNLVKEEGALNDPFSVWHLYGGNINSTNWQPQFQVTLTNSVRYAAESITYVTYGTWAHITGVYNGSGVTIYVNGIDAGGIITGLTGSPLLVFNQPLYIGAHGLPGEFMKGQIDDIRIYDRALTAVEVFEAYGGSANPASKKTKPVGRRR